MDSLTPDKDDMERFRKERKRTAAVTGKADAQDTPLTAKRDTPIKPEPILSNVRTGASARASQPRNEAASKSGPTWVGVLALLLALGVGAAGFWLYGQQRNTIALLESQLAEANEYISQSKLVLARLEGSLSETEATVLQSDSKLTTRLAGIDSEIRKLWDLANKRNAAQIKEHQNQIASLQTTSKQLQTTSKQLQTTSEQMQERLSKAEQNAAGASKAVSEQTAKLTAGLKSIEELSAKLAQLETAQKESLAQLGKEYQAQLTALTRRVEAIGAKLDSQPAASPLEGRLKEVETAIEAIDMSRQQVNRRVVDLERRLNETQLKLNSVTSVSGG